MKRVISIFAALSLLILAFALPVYATGTLPWEDTNVKVNILSDFNSFADGAIDPAAEPFWTGTTEITAVMEWDQGRLVFTSADGTGLFFRINDANGAGVKGNTAGYFTNVEGLGFYVENNSAEDAVVGVFMISSGCFAASAETVFTLVNDQNVISEGVNDGNGNVTIPSGFKGYVNMDITTLVNLWNGSAAFDPAVDFISMPGFNVASLTVDSSNSESFVIDNLYVYGANVTEDNTVFTVEQGAWATDEPTGEPTDEPTEEPSETADVSTIAYALAAVVGCGALVIRKKK